MSRIASFLSPSIPICLDLSRYWVSLLDQLAGYTGDKLNLRLQSGIVVITIYVCNRNICPLSMLLDVVNSYRPME
jgi:hypothetical protein